MRGEATGALHGVPVTVKDTIEVRGLPATAGTKIRAAFVPESDAVAVARLRAAGAIILGKTNTSELALDYVSDNPVYGRTNNPFDLTRTPGGSSGGCAAAVSACLSAGSLGSDLVGSIRIPAHFCGVAGLKPTSGCVPGTGHFPPVEGPFALAASLGPVARRVEDVALLFAALTGETQSLFDERPGFGLDDIAALRGVRCAWYTDDGVVTVTDETRAAVVRAADALKNAGLAVIEERPPGVARGTEIWLALFSTFTQKFVRDVYDGREGDAGPAARVLLERASSAKPLSLDEYFAAWSERDRVRQELLKWMETTPLLVAPVGAVPAFEHGARKVSVNGEEIGVFRAFGYAQAFNVFDLPAASVPAGRSARACPSACRLSGVLSRSERFSLRRAPSKKRWAAGDRLPKPFQTIARIRYSLCAAKQSA